MAEPDTWQEADLLQLVSEKADESLELDFKEAGALQKTDGKKRDLSKDVSAFANSAGGTLVYGIIEDQETHAASALDDGFDPTDISKEWVEQVINSNIQPRISGVRIHAVDLITHKPGNVAYVVTVPKSATAHQAADKRYYKRFNFQSVPMEDYEVRDVMQRVGAPRISIHAEMDGRTEGDCEFHTIGNNQASPIIDFFAQNAPDAGICEYSQIQIFVQAEVEGLVEIPFQDSAIGGSRSVPARPSATLIRARSGSLAFKYHEINLIPTNMPIFPGERRLLCKVRFIIPEELLYQKFSLLLWRSRPAMSDAETGAIYFAHEGERSWYFGPLTLEELEEKYRWSVELAP